MIFSRFSTSCAVAAASIKKLSGRRDRRVRTRLAWLIVIGWEESDSAPSVVVASESEVMVGEGYPPSENSASPTMRTEMGLWQCCGGEKEAAVVVMWLGRDCRLWDR